MHRIAWQWAREMSGWVWLTDHFPESTSYTACEVRYLPNWGPPNSVIQQRDMAVQARYRCPDAPNRLAVGKRNVGLGMADRSFLQVHLKYGLRSEIFSTNLQALVQLHILVTSLLASMSHFAGFV
jgi:hypothetical protein